MDATQATPTNEQVRVCHGCGIPRNESEPYYERLNARCVPCRLLAEEEQEHCDGCDEDAFDTYSESMFFSPFDDEEQDTGFTFCMPCLDGGRDDPDGERFNCDGCNRDIASTNGRMTHYRILNECEMVCLKCIEEGLKSGGVAAVGDDDLLADIFNGHKLFGMFFNVGELEDEGWTADPDFHNAVVGDGETMAALGERCRWHHEAGRPFIVEYESLSIIGDEGYITLRVKYGTEEVPV